MHANQETIDQGFELFSTLVEEDAVLRAEFDASFDEYFRSGHPAASELEKVLAARRHLEWFLLERQRAPGDAPLILELFERCAARGLAFDKEQQQTFLNSHSSIFEVTGVRAGEGIWVRDLTGLGEHPVFEPQASIALKQGDLIAGRIFPLGDALYHVSRAAAFFRNPVLLEGLHQDLNRAREGRRGALRLAQTEIEAMFFGPHAAPATEDPIADARTLLHDAGLDREQVEALIVELGRDPLAGESSPLADSNALAEVLDRLAFETSTDLDLARRVLLQARIALTRGAPAAPTGPNENGAQERPQQQALNVAHVVAEFDRKRKSGVPIEQLFDELEQELQLDTGDAEGEELEPAPDFPGVVAAVVEEFLWEVSRERGEAAAAELDSLRSLGRCCTSTGVLENFGLRDLLTYTCYWLPESGELHNAEDAQRILAALKEFSRWLEESQQLHIDGRFKALLKSLRVSLPRIIEANRRRTRAADREQGVAFEVLAVDEAGAAHLRTPDGTEEHAALDPWIAQWLRAGDRVRGQVTQGRLAVYCCYPPEGAALSSA